MLKITERSIWLLTDLVLFYFWLAWSGPVVSLKAFFLILIGGMIAFRVIHLKRAIAAYRAERDHRRFSRF